VDYRKEIFPAVISVSVHAVRSLVIWNKIQMQFTFILCYCCLLLT